MEEIKKNEQILEEKRKEIILRLKELNIQIDEILNNLKK